MQGQIEKAFQIALAVDYDMFFGDVSDINDGSIPAVYESLYNYIKEHEDGDHNNNG